MPRTITLIAAALSFLPGAQLGQSLLLGTLGVTTAITAVVLDQGAINDFDSYIDFAPKDHMGYYFRGLVREKTGDLDSACSDWIISNSLGHKRSGDLIEMRCQ